VPLPNSGADGGPTDTSDEAAAGSAATKRPADSTKAASPEGERFVSRHCDSCGRDDEETLTVHRVYVTPEAWDTEEKVEILDEVEQWCFACRSHYPHQEVEASS
jgi:hypothetical protein